MNEIDERMAQEARKTAEGLSDEQILSYAKGDELNAEDCKNAHKDDIAYMHEACAAVLRDYVRLRGLMRNVDTIFTRCAMNITHPNQAYDMLYLELNRLFNGVTKEADRANPQYEQNIKREEELKDKVYGKYAVTDARTGEKKDGKYFILKIDAKEDLERNAVREAMKTYIAEQLKCGKGIYASQVALYAGIQKGEVTKSPDGEGGGESAVTNGGVSREDREKMVTLYEWAKETKKKVETLGMFKAAGSMGLFLNTTLSTLGEVLPNMKVADAEDGGATSGAGEMSSPDEIERMVKECEEFAAGEERLLHEKNAAFFYNVAKRLRELAKNGKGVK